jgi:hypothetical protein
MGKVKNTCMFSRVKRPGHEAERSPTSGAEDGNGGAIPSLPHMSAWPDV